MLTTILILIFLSSLATNALLVRKDPEIKARIDDAVSKVRDAANHPTDLS